MATWSLPTVEDTWANIIAYLKNRDEDLAKGLDPATTTPVSLPIDAIGWSSADSKWKKWNGSSWVDLAATYAINISGAVGSIAWTGITGKPTTLTGYGITDAQPLDADLTALAALAATAGMLSRIGADSFAVRTLTAPAAGISISNPTGAAGNPTLALANDLAAIEGLASTGVACRTGTDTWAQRSITAGSGISVANPAGIAGDIQVSVASGFSEFAAGTRLLFQQTSAPTGWTKEAGAAYNDAALRFVTGTAGTGGADVFSSHFGSGKSTASYALQVSDIPPHTHGVNDPGHSHGLPYCVHIDGGAGAVHWGKEGIDGQLPGQIIISNTTGISIQNAGGGGGHSHTLSNFNIKYVDAIICTKN